MITWKGDGVEGLGGQGQLGDLLVLLLIHGPSVLSVRHASNKLYAV